MALLQSYPEMGVEWGPGLDWDYAAEGVNLQLYNY